MTETLTASELEVAMERFVRNQLAIKALEEEQEAIKGFFKGNPAFEAGTTVTSGKFYVRVSTNQRIDDGLAKKVLTTTQYKNVSKTVIDPVKARRALQPSTIDKITKVYENRIEIGLA